MKFTATLTPLLLSVIAVLLGMIWHKMPGKDNLPVLAGEYRKLYQSKGGSQAKEALDDRVPRLDTLFVEGKVRIDDVPAVRVSLDSDLKIDTGTTIKVEVQNDRPIPVVTDGKSSITVETPWNKPIRVAVE